tara:strand:+ start:209 stop:511 length:303 start_codon:yes stop_codon:yes gene_type:complete
MARRSRRSRYRSRKRVRYSKRRNYKRKSQHRKKQRISRKRSYKKYKGGNSTFARNNLFQLGKNGVRSSLFYLSSAGADATGAPNPVNPDATADQFMRNTV